MPLCLNGLQQQAATLSLCYYGALLLDDCGGGGRQSSAAAAAPTSLNTPRPRQRPRTSRQLVLAAGVPTAQRTIDDARAPIPDPYGNLLTTTQTMIVRRGCCSDHLRAPALSGTSKSFLWTDLTRVRYAECTTVGTVSTRGPKSNKQVCA